MDRARIAIALAISFAVIFGWPFVMRYLYPPAPAPVIEEVAPSQGPPASPVPPAAQATAPQSPAPPAAPPVAATQEAPRDLTVITPYWRARLSNRGAVATSWIIEREKVNGKQREIHAAAGGPLELIPQDAIERLGAPLRVRTPWAPALADEINQVNFKIEGVADGENEIRLNDGEQRTITFTYASPTVTARKTFTFYGSRFVFDATAAVTAGGAEQPVQLALGPRIGDQTDKQTGSYATPPQAIALTSQSEAVRIPAMSITPPFGTVVGVDSGAARVVLDRPLAPDIDSVKFVGADETTFLGYARVTAREENGARLTLDRLPEGVAAGSRVAQGLDLLRGSFQWAGVVDHYFAMVAMPPLPAGEVALADAGWKTPISGDAVRNFPSVAVPVDASAPTHIFIGPKDRELLEQIGAAYNTDLGALIDYGFFSFFVRPLLPVIGWALDGLAALFKNYGWAIVAVTVVINLALSPLRYYSSKKMKAAAKHQPRMKELQDRMKKLRDNPKRNEREMLELQKEQMALMREANPLGGCLPLLLQMPIFWAFFVYLTISLDVRQAPWILWIHDLSAPDPYYVLPIVMCVTMIASTMLTPMPASNDPAMKMQRMMMTWLMPIMLTWFFFLSSPSGLVLYWMVSNLMGVAIQLAINKLTAEPAPGPPTGGGDKKKTPAPAGKTRQGKRALTGA